MITAYSTKPTATCLPERKHATSFETALSSQSAIDRMAKMAKAESKAAGFGQSQEKRGKISEAEILEALKDNPGIPNVPLSELLRRNRTTLTARLKELADAGKIRVETERKGGRNYARYWAV